MRPPLQHLCSNDLTVIDTLPYEPEVVLLPVLAKRLAPVLADFHGTINALRAHRRDWTIVPVIEFRFAARAVPAHEDTESQSLVPTDEIRSEEHNSEPQSR